MPEQSSEEDGSDCIGELLDQAMDLTARFLTDRADLSASAGFAVNRLCREGPIRLTALAAKEGMSQPTMTPDRSVATPACSANDQRKVFG